MEKENNIENLNPINKKLWLNNSLIDQFFIKAQIWHQKWPLIFQKILGIDMQYPLVMLSLGHLVVIIKH
jgi:hypothetical protein